MDADFSKKVKQKKIRKIAIFAVLAAVCVIIAISVLKPGKAKSDGTKGTATIEIRCDQLSQDPDQLNDPALEDYLPKDGTILEQTAIEIEPGVTNVFEITDQVCKEKNIQIEYSYSPGYDSHYIEGINYFYEFSAGTYSGWIFTVNGESANYGADKIILQDGDAVVWNYTVDFRAEDTPVMGGEEQAAEEGSTAAAVTDGTEDAADAGSENKMADDSAEELRTIRQNLIDYLISETPDPTVSPIGGEWLIKGLVLADAQVPEGYYEKYYSNVCRYVEDCDGILSDKRYTEYERVIIGLCAIGKDPADVAGYDLTPYIDDYDQVTWQGVNAACYALISAKESGITLNNENAYIEYILQGLADEKMKSDMSFADYLAFGLEAMSFYSDRQQAAAFIDNTVGILSELQEEDGSYGNCEATAEVIVGLTMAGIDPQTDERFIKNGNSLADGLLVYYDGQNGFRHLAGDEKTDRMSCEKALLAMDALALNHEGKGIYAEP